MEKIIGIGNALVDILVKLEDESVITTLGLQKGGMVLIDEEKQLEVQKAMEGMHRDVATGGSAGNAILALGCLGASPAFIGRIGEDEMGSLLRSCYAEKGIELRAMTGKQHTGVANTFITPDGERTFATCLGAAALMEPQCIGPELMEGYDLLHVEGYLVQSHQLIETIMRQAKAMGMRISIDLASYNVVLADLEFFRHLVREYVDVVFANEEESAAFTGQDDSDVALREIAQMCEVAIVKLGARGASAMRHGEKALVAAHHVDVVDTTAAGDFFAGGFLYALAVGATLEKCLKCGAYLSENVIQVIGTQVDEQKWKEIRQNVGEILR